MKKWVIIVIISVIVLGSGAGVILARDKIFKGKNKNSNPGIKTTTVRRGDITVTVSATGKIEPLVIVEVRSKASGAITKLAVEEGDKVNAGDLIAEIEKTYTQADVEQAEADLKSAQARLKQAEMNIELQKQQYQTQLKQAQENYAAAQARLLQLEKQLEFERESNERQIKEAEKDLEMAKLRLRQLMVPREESVQRAKIAVDQAKANLDLARGEYERRKALYEKNFVSKSELDSAEAQLKSAQAQYDSAIEQLKLAQQPASEDEIKLAEKSVEKAELALASAKQKAVQQALREKDLELYRSQLEEAKASLEMAIANKAQIALREKERESAQASLTRAQVALKAARDRLADTRVVAPISGTILERNVAEGQVITSSMGAMASAGTLLVTMANLDEVYVRTDVDETDIGKIREGQPVTITVDAFPDRKFQGKVLKIAPQGKAVQNVTTFKVTTVIENPSNILKPGMNASVEIIAEDVHDVLVVENEAIMDTPQGKMVIPVIDGKPGSPIPVEVGVRGWDTTEIIFGVEEGDQLMIISSPGTSQSGQQPPWMKDLKNPMSTFGRMQGVGPGFGPGGPRR